MIESKFVKHINNFIIKVFQLHNFNKFGIRFQSWYYLKATVCYRTSDIEKGQPLKK